MKTVALYTIAPAGNAENDYNEMEQFTAELNRFYEKFNLHVDLTAYGMTLPVRKGGQYSVKALQNPLMGQIRKSVLCCIIFFCKKEELAADEMNNLMRNLMQQKKAEVVAYFKPNEDMQPVRNDIMRRLIQIDEKTVLSGEDQKRLSDMAKNFLNYGCIRDRENKVKEAEAAYKESLVIQRKLVKVNPKTYLPDLSLPYHNLGTLYYRTNRLKEAEFMYNEALKTRRQLVQERGDVYLSLLAASGTNMGALYVRTNRFEEAEKIYLEVLGIRKKLAESAKEDERSNLMLADICGNLGNLYNKLNRLEEAEEKFREALEIEERLLERYNEESEENQTEEKNSEEKPERKRNMDLEKKAAMTSNTLGVLYLKQKRPEEAEARYLTSFKLYTGLAEEKADEFEPPLAMVCYNLGNIYRSLKQPEEAGKYLNKAYTICAARQDSNAMCKQLYQAMNEAKREAMQKSAEIVRLLEKKGQEERESGNYEAAIETYRQAAGLYFDMKEAEYQAKAALLYNELGLLYWDTNQLEQAEASYQASLNIYRKLAEADTSHLSDVAIASYNLGLFYQETKDEEVNDYLREAFETAGKCLEDNEQCREIYENLEDEPLYGHREGESDQTDSIDSAGKDSSSVGWWKKLWGKK